MGLVAAMQYRLMAATASLIAISPPSASPASPSTDNASLYSSIGPTAWMSNAHQGGRNLGRWTLASTPNEGSAGRFLGDSSIACADINVGGKSFALFASPASSPAPTSSATRRFAKPAMTTGDALSFVLAVNYRNGTKGFTLRDSAGSGRFNFTVGRVDGVTGGYYIRNGTSAASFDNGQSFGPYAAQTYFAFTFTQEPGAVSWTAQRLGTSVSTVTGSFSATSGTIADLHFFVTGTEAGATDFTRAANNLYFNDITFTPATRGDSPLTPGERRLPGVVPSHTLKYQHSSPASTMTVRHSGDGFVNSIPMTVVNGIWELDIRELALPPGWHEFKFRPDGEWETGTNRSIYLDEEGRLAKPPAVYLTWRGDPTSTMVVHWHNYSQEMNSIAYRPKGSNSWTTAESASEEFPYSERWIHTSELTDLAPDTEYEFNVDGYGEVYRFKTMPSSLTRPVKFAVGGDVDIGSVADTMTSAIASHSPDFVVVGGDLAYADARASLFQRWYRYFESWHKRARTTDGRLIPKLVAVGNHEVYNGFVQNHPDFEPTAAWRARNAPYFYSCFAFPGQPGYGVLDFGQYMSLVILDTDHTNRIEDQSGWLSSVLSARRGLPHLIPVYHVPAYPSNRGFNDTRNAQIRTHWVPPFESAGVRLVFEHHDHTFKATKPLLAGIQNADGIVFMGDGLWGIGSRAPDQARWYLQGSSQGHHVHLVTVSSSGRTISSVGLDGQFFGTPSSDGVLLSQPTDEPPPSVTPSVTSMGRGFLTLAWSPAPRANSYRVIRSDGQEFEVAGPQFTDSEWSLANSYSYEIFPLNRSGSAPPSERFAPSPRQTWAASNGLPWDGTGIGAMDHDPDADGRANLEEYFHGTDPLSPSLSPVWVPSGSGNGFEARYLRSSTASGVEVEVLWSESLSPSAEWSTLGVSTRMIGPDPTAPLSNWYGVSVPFENPPSRLFMKLRVLDSLPEE